MASISAKTQIPSIGTIMNKIDFKILCYKLAAEGYYTIICRDGPIASTTKFICGTNSKSNPRKVSNTTPCGFIIELNREGVLWNVHLSHNHPIVYSKKIKKEMLIKVRNYEVKKIKLEEGIESKSREALKSGNKSSDDEEEAREEYSSSDDELNSSGGDEDAEDSKIKNGVRYRAKRNRRLAGNSMTIKSDTLMEIANSLVIKEDVRLLMQTGPISLPSVDSDYLASTPTELRIRISAAAQQRGFSMVKYNSAESNLKQKNFTLSCGQVIRSKCPYKIEVGKVLVDGEVKWKCTEVFGEHNHLLVPPNTINDANDDTSESEDDTDTDSDEPEASTAQNMKPSTSEQVQNSSFINIKNKYQSNFTKSNRTKRQHSPVDGFKSSTSSATSTSKSIRNIDSNVTPVSSMYQPSRKKRRTSRTPPINSSLSADKSNISRSNLPFSEDLPEENFPLASTSNSKLSIYPDNPSSLRLPLPLLDLNHSKPSQTITSSQTSLEDFTSFLYFLSPSFVPLAASLAKLGLTTEPKSHLSNTLINLISMNEDRLKGLFDSIGQRKGEKNIPEMLKVILRKKLISIKRELNEEGDL